MSLVFVVGSEEALSGGVPWCKKYCRQVSSTIYIAVLGQDRKTLLEHTRGVFEKEMGPDDQWIVQPIEQSADAIIEFANKNQGKTLLLIDGPDADAVELAAFAKSPIRTFFLRSSNWPPGNSSQVSVAFHTDRFVASVVSQELFGLAVGQGLLPQPEATKNAGEVYEDLREAMQDRHEKGQLLLIQVDKAEKSDPVFAASQKLMNAETTASIAIFRSGETRLQLLVSRLKGWAHSVAPSMSREERLELVKDLEVGSTPNLEFLGLISAASMLAAFGLLQDSAAVIIGAMLIAPLMTPILGAGLALTHGNKKLFNSALCTIALGFVGALVSSILFGLLVWLLRPSELDHRNWITSEMWARCRPSPLDFCVGLVGGLAAAYARTRAHLSAALAGAAIAAALVPPISTAGLQIAFWVWGTQKEGIPIFGPLLLVSINVLTITIGTSFILWLRGMRADRRLSSRDRWVMRAIAVLVMLSLLALVVSVFPQTMFHE